MGGAWPTTMGYGATSIWTDEAAKIDRDVLNKLRRKAQFVRELLPPSKSVVKPEQVGCRYCGAEPGMHCQRWRRTKRGKVRQNRDSPHPDRKYDAKLATTALTALTINR